MSISNMPEAIPYLIGFVGVIILIFIGSWVIEKARVTKDDFEQDKASRAYWMGVASSQEDEIDFGDLR